MMENINYDSLLILCLFAFITPIIINSFKNFKVPFVVGEILIGVVIGKSFLNLVHEDIWIIFISDLGLAFLMFLSGLEINIDITSIRKNKKRAFRRLLISFFMFAISLGISFTLSYVLFTLGIITDVLFMGFIFAASAPGLMVPLMKERRLINTEYGQTLLIFSIISEFICLISIIIMSSTIINGLSYKSFLFIFIFLSAFLIYFILKKLHQTLDFSTDFFNTLHLGVRAALAIILILVTISNKVGSDLLYYDRGKSQY